MHTNLDFNGVNDEDLKCLIMWPDNTIGYFSEEKVIAVLNALCKSYGYGRIPQIAQQIEQIWRYPEKIAEYENIRKDHVEFIESCRKATKES